MTSRRKLSEFGAASNGGGVEGIIRSALDSIDEGGTLVFDAIRYEGNTSPSFEYAVFSPIVLSKSVFIEGESSDIRIVNKSVNSAAFIVQPLRDNFFVGFENLSLISGTTGILFTGSHTLSPNSRIYNVALSGQALHGIKSTIPEVNLHLENIWVYGGQQFGFHFENNKNHVNLSIDKVKIQNTTIAAIHFSNAELNSGSVYISETELNDNNQAIVVDNLRYYEHNVEYFQNQANYVLSGASVRLTGSAGGGGGGGVTDHGGLTGLADDDHKQYLLVNGARGMSGSINMNGFDITNVGVIDGIDLSTLNNMVEAHITDVDNPHSTKFSNLVPETLGDLNDAITDGNVVSEAIFNESSASLNSFTASIQAFTATIVSFTASVQTLTSSLISTSASHELSINALLNSSGTFNSQIQTLFNVSASHTSQINPLKAATASLQLATASLQSATASLQTVSASLIAASASYRSELNFQTASINLLTAASSTFRSQLNSQTASIVSLQAFSSSHYLRHLSGAADQINAQDLGANGIGINRVLISNGLGGWTTILSSALGAGGSGGTPDPHAASHLSGASDPIDAHLLRANGIGRDRVLIADGLGGWITVLSSAIGIYDHGALSGLADNDHPQYALSSVVNAMSASLQEATASLQSATASLQTVSSSYLAVSASYNALSASYINFSNSLNSASASFATRLNVLTNASATFRSELTVLNNASATFRLELNSLTSSVVRLDGASGTFRSELNSQTASINLLTAASSTFRTELNSQTASIVRFDSASGTFRSELNIITAASSTFRTQLNAQTASIVVLQAFSQSHASRHLSGGVDPIDAQLLRGNGVGQNRLLISDGFGGWTTVISTSVGTPPGAPANHATTHLSGGSDQVSAQQLAADGVSANRLLISNAAGGWTTILSNSISGKDYDSFTASVQLTTASLLAASSSFESRIGILTNASATFRVELTALTSSITRLDAASGTFRLELNAQTASINLLTAASSTFRSELTALTSTVTKLNAASGTFRTELNVITAASSTFRAELNSQTASIVVLQAFSQSHGSRHLSGAVDQINAQDLGANGIAINRLLISNAAGGWTTIPSSSITGKDYDSFTASVQLTTASLIAASASFNSSITVLTNASATFRSELNSQTASIARLDSASGTFRTELNAQTASINLLTAASSTFRTELTALTSTVTGLNAASATFRSELNVLTNASATFRNELNSQTASIARLDAASGTFRSELTLHTASINLLTAASSTFRTELNSQTASIARLDAASGTFRSELTILTNASATFRTELTALTSSVVRLDNASGTFRTELTALTSTVVRLNAASGTFRSELNSQTASINLITAASSTFRTELTALTSTVVRLDAASGTFRSELNVLTNASASYRLELNSQTASIVVLQAFSSSHASRHLSGAADQISAQSLAANGISANQLLISNAAGGWTTVASQSIGGAGKDYDAFTASMQLTTASLIAASASFNSSITVLTNASATFRTELTALTSTVVRLDAASGTFRSELTLHTASINLLTAASSTFRTELTALTSTVARLDAASGTFRSELTVLNNASATFRSELNSQTASIVRLDAASGTFVTNLNSQTASINLLTAASSTFRTELNSQTASIARLDSASGTFRSELTVLTNASATFRAELTALTNSVVRLDNASGTFRSELTLHTASINLLTAASSTFRTELTALTSTVVRLDAASGTFRTELTALTSTVVRLDSASGTFRTELTALTNSVVRLDSASGTFRTQLNAQTASINLLTAASSTFRTELTAQTASIVVLQAFSSSHAARHLSGAADQISAQSLAANGVAVNHLLISNAAGGWTTIASSSVGGGSGGAHASTHLSGGADPIDAQLLRGDGLSPDRVLVSDGLGGWKTVASSSIATTINYSGSAIPSNGFYSMRTTDYFTASTTGTMPGSSSFVAVVLYMPFEPINNTKVHTLLDTYVADNGSGDAGGFKFSISYQQLHANAYTIGGGAGAIVDSTITTWDPRHAFGNLYPYALRVRGASATSITASVWSGVAKIGEATSSAAFSAAPNSKLFVGWSNNWFGDDTALSGGIYGIGYYEGDLNDDQMRTLLGRCLSDGEIPVDVINWTLAYRGEDLVTVAPQISASIGGAAKTLVKIGSPSGSTAFISPGTGGRLVSSPGNHAITHISGGVDPIDVQSLRADGIAANRLLISNTNGGWTTIPSSSVGGGGVGTYATSSILSILNQTASVWLRYDTSISGAGTSVTYWGDITSNANHATHSVVSECPTYISQSVFFDGSNDKLIIKDVGSSLDPTNCFMIAMRVKPGTYSGSRMWINKGAFSIQESGELRVWIDTAGSTGAAIPSSAIPANGLRTLVALWDGTQSTNQTKLRIRVDGIEMSCSYYGTIPTSVSAYGSDLFLGCNNDGASQFFTGAMKEVIFSKMVPTLAQVLEVERVLTYGPGTLISHAGTHLSGGTDQIDAQNLGATGIPVNQLLVSNMSGGWTTIATSSISGAIRSHAITHLSGGSDPIDAQSLRGNGLAIDRLLITDGLGGWTTVASSSVVDNFHGQFHLSGAKDALNAQSLGASGISANQLLISNADGGWTTVASQSVGGGGGGITNVQSASTEGRSLLSGVFGGIAYIKTIKSLTASLDGLAISDTSPILLSSSDDTVYIKRRPTSTAAFLFEDFIGGVTTAAGFSWTFVAGGTGASIQTDSVSSANRETYMGSAVGVISLDTGTTAAGGVTVWGGQSSFSIGQLTASSIEWRLVASGSSSAASQDHRVQFGWFNTVLSGVRRPTAGIFFEMTASNRATWNIVAISGASTTAYATSEPINSASFMKYKIETIQNPIGAFTSSFYVNDILIGAISTSLPISRNQPVGPAARIVKEIGIAQRDLFIDWCELFYEINR